MQNNILAALKAQAPKDVLSAIQTASRKTGVDFAYMMQQASAESSFNPSAKARTSSATGLYQFIDSTWMNMIEKHGEKYGIDTNQDKQSLLSLRKNPEIASFMAAEFARENKDFLEQNVGGEIGATEMYFAHFLGASGAAGFLSARNTDGNTIAAHIFPKESAANRNVFYDSKTGSPRTLNEVYAFFDKKFGGSEATKLQNQPISPVFKDPQPLQEDLTPTRNSTYVAIPQPLKNSIASLYSTMQADATTALLAFAQPESSKSVVENKMFAATRSLYSAQEPSQAYQQAANNAENRGFFGKNTITEELTQSRIALSQLDFLSLYNTDILA